MAGNSNLHDSSRNKQDEFYTNLQLIEDELKHYRPHFKDKSVLCNCDDPYESNFFKYFAMNFNALGLKSLTATCYAASPFAQLELDLFGDCFNAEAQSRRGGGRVSSRDGVGGSRLSRPQKQPYKIVITEVKDENGDGRIDLADVEWLIKNRKNVLTKLKGDGDFRSAECVALLKDADIVVTNPPFSLFREYMAQLMEHKKQFLIIGNMNNICYKEVFPLIQRNEIWLGVKSGHFWFKVPQYYEEKSTDFKIDDNGQKWRRMGNICWFTNLDFEKRHEKMLLWKKYTPDKYPHYVNYDGIDVAKTDDIPCDYDGNMGVPITFMSQYNPDQFEIVGASAAGLGRPMRELAKEGTYQSGGPSFYIRQKNGAWDYKRMYNRIVIRRKEVKA